MADHKHGEMDTSIQQATFGGFISFVSKAVVAILVFLVFLALVNG